MSAAAELLDRSVEVLDYLAGLDQQSVGVFLLACVGLFVVVMHRGQKRTRRRRLAIVGRRRNFATWQRRRIYAKNKGRCVYCGVKVHFKSDCKWRDGCNHDFQADHLIPYADGGPTTVANGVTACRFHNQSKGAKSIDHFLATSRHRRRGRTPGAPVISKTLRVLDFARGAGKG